jgi:hypothetical protein
VLQNIALSLLAGPLQLASFGGGWEGGGHCGDILLSWTLWVHSHKLNGQYLHLPFDMAACVQARFVSAALSLGTVRVLAPLVAAPVVLYSMIM